MTESSGTLVGLKVTHTSTIAEKQSKAASPVDLADLMAEYERTHAVEGYLALGWHVWPLLRTWMTFDLYGYWEPPGSDGGSPSIVQRNVGRLRKHWALARGLLRTQLRDRSKYDSPIAAERPVVLLTYSNRRSAVGRSLTHRIADPLTAELATRGIETLIWERGEACPRAARSAWIEHRLALQGKFAERRTRSSHAMQAPKWFAELSAWLEPMLGRKVSWQEPLGYIRQVTLFSEVFQRWLPQAGCKLLMLDCWYSAFSMAASLAASRLGITTMDIQHGIQAPHHWSYRSWNRTPATGYEVIPDAFWFWGDVDAESFRDNNKVEASIFVGGNLWLNQWRNIASPELASCVDKASQLRGSAAQTVLVSFSLPTEYHLRILEQVIPQSPDSWRWLIRLHPGQIVEIDRISNRLNALGHPGIEVEQSTALPLYALLQVSDVHLTRNSTCALEALAFGIPTMVMHEEGKHIFDSYIQSGTMVYEDEPRRILNRLVQGLSIQPEHCLLDAQKIFAPREQSGLTIDTLASLILND